MAEYPREVRAGEPISAAWLNNLVALVSQRLHLEGQGYSSSSGTAAGRSKTKYRRLRGILLGPLSAPDTVFSDPTTAQVQLLRKTGDNKLTEWEGREATGYNFDPDLTGVEGAYCHLVDMGDGILEFAAVSCSDSTVADGE